VLVRDKFTIQMNHTTEELHWRLPIWKKSSADSDPTA
jgi:hypothetical protein